MSTLNLFSIPIEIKHLDSDLVNEIDQEVKACLEINDKYWSSEGQIGRGSDFMAYDDPKTLGSGITHSGSNLDVKMNWDLFSSYDFSTLEYVIKNEYLEYINIHTHLLTDVVWSSIDKTSIKLESWLLKNDSDASGLLAHQHENRFLNCVYYHEMPDLKGQDGGELVLYSTNPLLSFYTFNSQQKEFINVSKGTLIVFPSFLVHAVNSLPRSVQSKRISISTILSFNEIRKLYD
jgi:hypothetical protein